MAKKESGVVQSLMSEVTCPLCLDIFTDPKRLPCEHVYCKECLRGLALRSTTGSISCPVCRADIPVPNYDVTTFSTPHQINRLIEIYQRNSKSAETAAAMPSCGDHKSEPLALYCETCETLVCRDCIIMTCAKKNHVYGFVDEVAKKYRTEMHREIDPVKCLHQQMSTALNTISASEEEVQSKKEAKLQEMRSSFDAFFEILEQERRYFTDTVKYSFQTQESLNSTRKNEICKLLEELEALIKHAEIASLQESDSDFLKGISNRKQSINDVQVCSRKATLHPATVPEVEVRLPDPPEFKAFFQEKVFVHQVLDGDLQRPLDLDLNDIPVLKTSEVFLHLNPHGAKKSKPKVEAEIVCHHRKSIQTVHVKKVSAERYSLSFSPKRRGQHELHIKYNDMHICGGPIPVYVTIHPDQITAVSKPKVTPLRNAAGIKCHGDKLHVSELGKAIIFFDPSTRSQERTRRVKLRGVNAVLIDGAHIYATDTALHRLVKMDMNGTIIKSRGGVFNFPNGIRLSKDDEIYVCDSLNHRIQIFDKDLNLVSVIGRRGAGNGCFLNPTDLNFGDAGNIYVSEDGNHRIQVLTPEGEHIRNIGRPGSGPGELNTPVSMAIHKNMVYVTDLGNGRISVFKTTGEFVTVFGAGILRKPETIAIDVDGYIHVADNRSSVITF